jgi:hypothetical protein
MAGAFIANSQGAIDLLWSHHDQFAELDPLNCHSCEQRTGGERTNGALELDFEVFVPVNILD